MALRQYKTNKRLWFVISLPLFVVPWFMPWFGHDLYISCPAVLWVALFARLSDFGETMMALGYIIFFILLFGVPAISIGWIVQCIIVMISGARKQKTQNAV